MKAFLEKVKIVSIYIIYRIFLLFLIRRGGNFRIESRHLLSKQCDISSAIAYICKVKWIAYFKIVFYRISELLHCCHLYFKIP